MLVESCWEVFVLNIGRGREPLGRFSSNTWDVGYGTTVFFCHFCGLFQNRAVASASYVLRVRFAAAERSAKTAY